MIRNCLASLFISKYAVKGECGLSALEASWLFFAQGYISACGDALYTPSSRSFQFIEVADFLTAHCIAQPSMARLSGCSATCCSKSGVDLLEDHVAIRLHTITSLHFATEILRISCDSRESNMMGRYRELVKS
jgi:hypothetical protein